MGIHIYEDKKGEWICMKIIVFLADGFEEVEALTVVDYLRRMDIEVDMVSINKEKNVKGAHGIEVVTDKLVGDLDIDEYKGVVIPGGLPGAANLQKSSEVIKVVKELNKQDKLVAAICAGPIVLQEAGVTKDRGFTCYPGFEGNIGDGSYIEKPVVRDKNIITGKGPALAIDFALEIVDYLLGKDKKEKLKNDILYDK